ncbi:hypothetical protein UFOVP97_35 [uncultured Caudovirales phage]|uniref:Trimeric autotransporter adhesin YadA-like head domain-containing protein n=1 Tax=uncultured Caudovirales phage TaxID=2100421 RepID=A0A6J5LN57_9CAUD|nr:hypothetical protein UFOVP97_35 [uncultured Caudovirales phage]CAB4134396.1 hypothetical protein UFOVP268_53 [uncultured Caudovirales phage]
MPIQLRIADNDPYLYIQPVSAGSVAIGTDAADSNKLKIVVSNAIADLDPTSGTPSLSIDPSANGNITFQPQGIGESIFETGDVALLSGNLDLTFTAVGGTSGVINFGGSRFIHDYQTNNTFVGNDAGNFGLTGAQNVGIGTAALVATTSGSNNVALGFEAGSQLTSGGSNTALGSAALFAGTTAAQNIAIGNIAMNSLITGANNIAIGYHAASAYAAAESSNIIIGNAGVVSESNQIRIGTQGSSPGEQDACNIAGIYGSSVTAAGTVVVDTSGNLGTISGVTPTVWHDVTSTPVTMAPNSGYVSDDGASLVTLTLPAVAAFGSTFKIVGKASGLWTIAQNAGQTIHYGAYNTMTGGAGSLSSTLQYDCVELVCVTANTDFVVQSSIGNLTVV